MCTNTHINMHTMYIYAPIQIHIHVCIHACTHWVCVHTEYTRTVSISIHIYIHTHTQGMCTCMCGHSRVHEQITHQSLARTVPGAARAGGRSSGPPGHGHSAARDTSRGGGRGGKGSRPRAGPDRAGPSPHLLPAASSSSGRSRRDPAPGQAGNAAHARQERRKGRKHRPAPPRFSQLRGPAASCLRRPRP